MKRRNEKTRQLSFLKPVLTYQSVPPGITRGEQRKIAIIEATISILAHKGIQSLTYESVGCECRISKSHVAYHFPSIEALLHTTVAYVYAVGQKTVSDHIEKERKAPKLLRAYVYGTFYWFEKHPEHASVAALLGYLSTWDEKCRRLQTQVKRAGLERIVAILQVMSGRSSKSYRLLADSIQSLLAGKILYFSATEKQRDLQRVCTETWNAIEQLIA